MPDLDANDETLLTENTKIIARFKAEGLDIDKTREINFQVALSDKDQCKDVRTKLRTDYDMPKDGLFMIQNWPEECILQLSLFMKPTPKAITLLESQFIAAASLYADAEVFWGFEG